MNKMSVSDLMTTTKCSNATTGVLKSEHFSYSVCTRPCYFNRFCISYLRLRDVVLYTQVYLDSRPYIYDTTSLRSGAKAGEKGYTYHFWFVPYFNKLNELQHMKFCIAAIDSIYPCVPVVWSPINEILYSWNHSLNIPTHVVTLHIAAFSIW